MEVMPFCRVCGGGVVGEAGFEQGNLRLDVFKLAGEVAERFFFRRRRACLATTAYSSPVGND